MIPLQNLRKKIKIEHPRDSNIFAKYYDTTKDRIIKLTPNAPVPRNNKK